jgi:hypothetical protein
MSDDTPTQRFDAQSAATGPVEPHEEDRKSRLPLILGIIGGVLLIAVIVLVVLLLGRTPKTDTASSATDASTPSDSSAPTPIPTPTVTVTVTASPAPNSGGGSAPQKPNGNNVLITQYTISPMTVDCSSGAPAGSTDLHITWKSVNGGAAFFGVNTSDAMSGGMGWTLPASGTQHNFPSGYDPYTYQCGNASSEYTITAIGNGSKQTFQITVHRK